MASRGVEVGVVREIALDPGDPSERLTLDIVHGTPVKTDSVAVLSSQGLTGIAYVDLGGGSREAPPLAARPG
ncbi:MAG: MCE family protein [Deltaproteobacteria bacterium]|nr:MCE family protein [Deltaproteobacteria bacterium]